MHTLRIGVPVYEYAHCVVARARAPASASFCSAHRAHHPGAQHVLRCELLVFCRLCAVASQRRASVFSDAACKPLAEDKTNINEHQPRPTTSMGAESTMPPLVCQWRKSALGANRSASRRRLHFAFSSGAFSHMPSVLMRGKLSAMMLNALRDHHNARASYLADARSETAVDVHFKQHGLPDVCVLVKYGSASLSGESSAAAKRCKHHDALVLFDCVDRHGCFRRQEVLSSAEFRWVDGFLTQTETHKRWIASLGRTAALLPHPHGNSGGWGRARAARPRVRRVGLLVGTRRNVPAPSDLQALAGACCRAGAELLLVQAPNALEGRSAFSAEAQPCAAADKASSLQAPRHCAAIRCDEPQPARELFDGAVPRGALRTMEEDFGGQALHYNSSSLADLTVDVALLWPPVASNLSAFAVHNRPPTRMHFWWSLGVPVVGYPMPAYVEAARRAGYPMELLHVTAPAQLESVLCVIGSSSVRECLREHARHGARMSSPQASAFQLLQAACEVAQAVHAWP